MIKMVMVVYNEAIDSEVMDAFQRCGLKHYTKVVAVYGSGQSSGIHLGDDIWPGRNNILYVVCSKEESISLLAKVKDLRKSVGREGVKAFVLPVEDLT